MYNDIGKFEGTKIDMGREMAFALGWLRKISLCSGFTCQAVLSELFVTVRFTNLL
jgi:hypothetical protein